MVLSSAAEAADYITEGRSKLNWRRERERGRIVGIVRLVRPPPAPRPPPPSKRCREGREERGRKEGSCERLLPPLSLTFTLRRRPRSLAHSLTHSAQLDKGGRAGGRLLLLVRRPGLGGGGGGALRGLLIPLDGLPACLSSSSSLDSLSQADAVGRLLRPLLLLFRARSSQVHFTPLAPLSVFLFSLLARFMHNSSRLSSSRTCPTAARGRNRPAGRPAAFEWRRRAAGSPAGKTRLTLTD